MNWSEGFRRIGLLLAIPILVFVALTAFGRLIEAAAWVQEHPLLVAGIGGAYLIGWWIAAGFRKAR